MGEPDFGNFTEFVEYNFVPTLLDGTKVWVGSLSGPLGTFHLPTGKLTYPAVGLTTPLVPANLPPLGRIMLTRVDGILSFVDSVGVITPIHTAGPPASAVHPHYSYPVRFHPEFVPAGFSSSSIVHWAGWDLVDTRHDGNTFTQQFPTWARETNAADGKRLNYVEQGLSIEENFQHVMNLYRAIPHGLTSFGALGITVRHRILFSGGGANPGEFAQINLEVFDPSNAADFVIASANRQVFANAPDVNYVDLTIPAAQLNAAGFVPGDLLYMRMFSTSGGFVDNQATIRYSLILADFA